MLAGVDVRSERGSDGNSGTSALRVYCDMSSDKCVHLRQELCYSAFLN